jgi:hypothetical protein
MKIQGQSSITMSAMRAYSAVRSGPSAMTRTFS